MKLNNGIFKYEFKYHNLFPFPYFFTYIIALTWSYNF